MHPGWWSLVTFAFNISVLQAFARSAARETGICNYHGAMSITKFKIFETVQFNNAIFVRSRRIGDCHPCAQAGYTHLMSF